MIRRLLNRIAMLFLLTSMLFNCSLGSTDKSTSQPVNDESRATYDVNRVPSQDPPKDVNGNPIPPSKAPQFIIIGYDDNQFDDGMYNIMNVYKDLVNPAGSGNPLTYDGTPARASFYCTPAGRDLSSGVEWQVAPETVVSWKAAYDDGHEIGNHTFYHEHGLQFDVARWKDEMSKGNDFLVNTVGIPRSAITGFRTPFLEYNPNTFIALKELGFEYDNSFEGGWRYWPTENGSTLYWPFTMDSGKPAGSEARDFGKVPGLWQMPTDCIFFESAGQVARVTGFDYNLWFSKEATKQEFVDMLKFSLNQKYTGNRSPMNFGGHTNYYSDKGLEEMKLYDPASAAKLKTTVAERTAAIREFLEYALTLPDVRIVTTQQALDWVKNPVPLDTAFVQHDVTVTASANGVVDKVGINKVVDGRDFTVTVNPDPGYMVDTFTVDGVSKTLTNNSFTLTNVKSATAINVTFKINQNAILHTVNVSSGANGSFDREGLITIEQGDPITLDIVPTDGYAVDVFSIDGTPVTAPVFPYTIENVSKDMTITATFKHVGVEYTMTYYWTYNYKDEPVGSASDPQVDLLTNDGEVIATVSQPLAERISMEGSGFLPDGRLINLANGNDWPAARFFVVDPAVAPWGYDSQGGPLIPWKSIAVDVNVIPLNSDVFVKEFEGITLPDGSVHNGWFKAVDTSHSFSGKWIDIFTGTYPNYQYMIANFPTFNKVTVSHQAGTVYTITPSHGLNGGMWPDSAIEVPEGFDRSFTFYPSEGYVVDQVLVDNTPVTVINNVYSFKDVRKSMTIDVTFKKGDPIPSFSVVGTAGVGGVVSPSSSTIEKGKDVTFVITPDTGFIVDKATLNGNVVTVTGDSYTAKNVQSDIVFDVTFKADIPSGLSATYTLGTDWGTGFGASVVVKNDSNEAVSAWEVTLTFSGNQQVSGWNGVFSQTGNVVTITNTSWNGTIPPGGSVSLGMNGSYSGENNPPTVSVK